ncbi:hypothetical protein C8R43DRAFT_960342 [Mycena crocata]|nr:hypothetical protein C8R43DRAFT_960342 [Mycena crocata]
MSNFDALGLFLEALAALPSKQFREHFTGALCLGRSPRAHSPAKQKFHHKAVQILQARALRAQFCTDFYNASTLQFTRRLQLQCLQGEHCATFKQAPPEDVTKVAEQPKMDLSRDSSPGPLPETFPRAPSPRPRFFACPEALVLRRGKNSAKMKVGAVLVQAQLDFETLKRRALRARATLCKFSAEFMPQKRVGLESLKGARKRDGFAHNLIQHRAKT